VLVLEKEEKGRERGARTSNQVPTQGAEEGSSDRSEGVRILYSVEQVVESVLLAVFGVVGVDISLRLLGRFEGLGIRM
jgi:hypothetical protein